MSNASLHHSDEERRRWEEGYLGTRRNVRLRRWRIRRLVDAPKEALLVEVGCGDGLNLEVCRDLGFEKLVGVEISVDLARAVPMRPVLAGDAEGLPFAEGSVETLFVDSVFHHLTDYRAAAFECHRVLSSGGRLFYFEPRPGPVRKFYDWVTFSPLFSWIGPLASRKQTLLEEWPLYQDWLVRHAEFADGLREAGLSCRYDKSGPLGMFLSFEKA